MLYNVDEMSTASTPSRPRPHLVIPGNESRALYNGKHPMLPVNGLPTPPNSALESRRPSLQFSAMNDYTASAGHNMGGFSQPSTPVRRAGSRYGEMHGEAWTEHAATTTNTPNYHMVHNLSGAHLSQPMLQPAFQPQQACRVSDGGFVGSYTDRVMSHTAEVFASPVDGPAPGYWESSHEAHQSTAHGVSSALGPPLFAMSQHTLSESAAHDALGIQTTPMYQQEPLHPSDGSFHGYGTTHGSIYGQPQVVVPSQLSPQDSYASQQFYAMSASHEVPSSYSSSFDSSVNSLDEDFEMVRPPSPDSRYFQDSETEDGWLQVRSDRDLSSSYDVGVHRTSSTRSRKRSTKRSRRTGQNPLYSHHVGGIEVSWVDFNPSGKSRPPAKSKPYLCPYESHDGTECGAKFLRMEHLKRHATKHSKEPLYPCPLEKCMTRPADKGGPFAPPRPDNAADHFKTHLRPLKGGKRNEHCDWPTLQRLIVQHYSATEVTRKRARKLIDNLQKWVNEDMPESQSQQRGTKCK